jgi:hypothetical protein
VVDVHSQIQRLLAPDYLGDLRARPIEELRSMRAECQEVETGLSYARRLVQGRLDIVEAERSARAHGEPADLASLLERLPEILADRTRTPGVGRLPQIMAPGDVGDELAAELDDIAGGDRLAALPGLDDAALFAMVDALRALEHRTSATRRELFARIDAISAELTRRYRTGEASVEALLEDGI